MDDDDLELAAVAGCFFGGCLLYTIYVLGFLAFWALVIFALVKYVFS